MGVVFTSTVAFNMLVFLTAETKKMKCAPRSIPSTKKCLALPRIRSRLNCARALLKTRMTRTSMPDAIINRQIDMENGFMSVRRIRMAAEPNSNPAVSPSSRENFLVFSVMERRSTNFSRNSAYVDFFYQPNYMFSFLGKGFIVSNRYYLFDRFHTSDCFCKTLY